MQLADFITANSETILTDWLDFAKARVTAASQLTDEALRDHAAAMLMMIVSDMGLTQTLATQQEKSWGLPNIDLTTLDSAATQHGAARAIDGFSIDDVVAEYRALRASVLRLYAAQDDAAAAATVDLTRFNEAVDQALAESVAVYARNVEYSRDMFIAVLGHDLRSPLSAVLMACQLMLNTQGLDQSTLANAERINRSAKRMSEMVSQLLDFTRARLGNGLPMTPINVDVAELAVDAVDEIRTAHPLRDVRYEGAKSIRARGDDVRIRQVLANLLGNAIQHGASDAGITVRLQEADNVVEIRVHNSGAVMSSQTMSTMFSPFKRLAPGTPIDPKSTSLGLGLYIAQQIVIAHNGTISATSDTAAGTEFLVRLPRGT